MQYLYRNTKRFESLGLGTKEPAVTDQTQQSELDETGHWAAICGSLIVAFGAAIIFLVCYH